MAVRTIITYPDQRLIVKSAPVEDWGEEIQTLVDDMAETMYTAPGIGLAAPQVGINRRVIVFDVDQREGRPDLVALVNPEIVECEGEILFEEGCLSVPEYNAEVKRSSRVCVRGMDRTGRPVELEARDLAAIVLQHEIDHLDGILFIDRISRLKRSLYLRRLKKAQQVGE